MSHVSNSFNCGNASDFWSQAVGGLVAAHPGAKWDPRGFIYSSVSARTRQGEPAVAVMSGGGSGHEPLHVGFVGEGMLNAAVPGQLFTSPNAVQIAAATQAIDTGQGVLHVVKNYTGDVMNFSVAAASVDTQVRTVVVEDDVATDNAGSGGPGRRGILGTFLVEKVAGAAAARGDNLDTVAQIAQNSADNTRSMSVAMAPGVLPSTGQPTFELPKGSMELGVGIHGERGVERIGAEPADVIVDKLLQPILEALGPTRDAVLVVGGLGGASQLELALIHGLALSWLERRGVKVRRSVVGNFVTAANMHGLSLTLTRVHGDLLELIDAPTHAPAWPNGIAVDPTYAPATMECEDTLPSGGPENKWLSGFVRAVQTNIDALTDLDRQAGDGDFGANMDAAFGDITLPVRGSHAEVCRALSQRLLVRAGGTSGAVFGTLLRELACGFEQHTTDVEGFVQGLRRGLEEIVALGGAQVGDNTMVDALAPAVDALEDTEAGTTNDLHQARRKAYAAAVEGVRSTRDMVASKGRASYVGEASRGVVDPGAIVTAWLLGGRGEVPDFD